MTALAAAFVLASPLVFLPPQDLAVSNTRPEATQSDPRVFGTWCQAAPLHPCREIERKIFGIPLGTTTVCVDVTDARTQLDYAEPGGRGLVHGVGRARVDGREVSFGTAGQVIGRGQVDMGAEVPGLGLTRGRAGLSGDGLQMALAAYEEVLVLRKDLCGNDPPEVSVVSQGGTNLTWGETHCFRGKVTQDEDESFPPQRMALRSDRDGPLGGIVVPPFSLGGGSAIREVTRCTSGLSPGPHTITFEATDSGGLSASATVDVEVTNQPPRLPILVQPRADDTIVATGDVVFEAKAFDPEEGILDGSQVRWAVRHEGGPFVPLGSGRRLLASLDEPGQVELRVTAVDGAGLESSVIGPATTVLPFDGNTPPRVTIEIPRHLDHPGHFGGSFESGPVTFRGTVDDSEDPHSALELRWDAEPILPAGPALPPVTGSTLAVFPLGSIGANRTIYRITFRATDRRGLEGKKVIEVIILP